MTEIRCECGKLLLEANGEVKKICPKCKKEIHVVVTSKGIFNISDLEKILPLQIQLNKLSNF